MNEEEKIQWDKHLKNMPIHYDIKLDVLIWGPHGEDNLKVKISYSMEAKHNTLYKGSI